MSKKLEPHEKPLVHTFKTLKGWNDVDFQMLHFCFEKLCDFVEKEKGLDSLEYQVTHYKKLLNDSESRKMQGYTKQGVQIALKEAKKNFDEVSYLYNWWKDTYLPLYKDNKWGALFDPECETIEQENLIRLITVRRLLWT